MLSYVASMRKQKATVWCDRAQSEDKRLLAQQKDAKMRATREVSGVSMEGRHSTGSMGSGSIGVRKIRHHGLSKNSGYNQANLVGGGVPTRLSASEVGDEGSTYGDGDSLRNANHHRTSSGRSSTGSNKRLIGANQKQPSRYSQASAWTSGHGSGANDDLAEVEETPIPQEHQASSQTDYFSHPDVPAEKRDSSDGETGFGRVGQMKGPPAIKDRVSRADEIRRRGSVDERSNTMGGLGGGGLYVANP